MKAKVTFFLDNIVIQQLISVTKAKFEHVKSDVCHVVLEIS